MSGGFPQGLELCNGNSIGIDLVNGRGTNVPPNSGTAGVFSAWVQLTASSPIDASWIVVSLQHNPSSNTVLQYNIGVGSAGNEKIIINQLITVNFGSNYNCYVYAFPVNIPAGSRISAQCAGDHNGNEPLTYVSIQLYDSGFVGMDGCAGVENVGITSNHGTAISVAASAKGSYVQLTGSSARDYMGFYVVIDPGGTATYGLSIPVLIDIAVGGAGSEKIIVPDICFDAVASYAIGSCGAIGPFWIPIPAGTAISARGAAGSSGTLGVMLLAMYQ